MYRQPVAVTLCLLAVAAATHASLDAELRADIERQVAAAKRKQEDHEITRWKHADRAVVERTCGSLPDATDAAGTPSERAVCMIRGMGLVEDLDRFGVGRRWSRTDVDKLSHEFATTKNAMGLWVRVQQGQITDHRMIGSVSITHGNDVVSHHLAYAALTHAHNGFGNTTFEYIAVLNDHCQGDPLAHRPPSLFPYSPASAQKGREELWFKHFPILSYARHHRDCPHHIVVPVTPWIHMYPNSFGNRKWKDLKAAPVFKGMYNSISRALLGFGVAAGKVEAEVALDCRMYPCYDLMRKYQVDGALPADIDVRGVCDKRNVCYDGARTDQMGHRVYLCVDGEGAVDRFARFFEAPGLVMDVGSSYDQFYSRDVLPWYHYANASSEPSEMWASVSGVVAYLAEKDAFAQEMAARQKAYYKHMNTRAKVSYFRLFAEVFSARWDDAESGPEFRGMRASGPVTAQNLASVLDKHWDKQKFWHHWSTVTFEMFPSPHPRPSPPPSSPPSSPTPPDLPAPVRRTLPASAATQDLHAHYLFFFVTGGILALSVGRLWAAYARRR